MKTLVALACAAVILTFGYFFSGEYERYAANAAASDMAEITECERVIVAFHKFALTGENVEFGGAEKFQNVAGKCASLIERRRGIYVSVTRDGVVFER